MKLLGLFCYLLFCLPSVVFATEAKPNPTVKAERLPGVAMSQGITEITGVAISPMLGVSAVGAWRYWHTAVAKRDLLPWYAQPWAWGTGLSILSLCFLKDTFGTAVPGILKKPFDMLELFENKASALVASSAFVPLIAEEMARYLRAEQTIQVPVAMIGSFGVGTIETVWIMVPLAVIAFLLVWVCSHAINVLIVISPFSTLDAMLKLARTGLLALIAVAYVIAPWLAAAFCLVLIAVAAYFAPAAMRLAIFGTSYGMDILMPWRGRKRATPDQPHGFTLVAIDGVPARTGGRIVRLNNGNLAFNYRRYCVFDKRTIPLPDGQGYVEKGLITPSLVKLLGGKKATKLLLFLRRYRGYEERIVESLDLQGVREHAVVRGFTAFKTWLRP